MTSENTETPLPILYSFRRCPYAMRARLAVSVSGQRCELREVVLRDKPPSLLEYSPKGTVPVLVLPDGVVIDESRDVMRWALERSDPEGWMAPETGNLAEIESLIDWNDGDFKSNLDRYKYATRYEGVDPIEHRDQAEILGRARCSTNRAGLFIWGTNRLCGCRDSAVYPTVCQCGQALV